MFLVSYLRNHCQIQYHGTFYVVYEEFYNDYLVILNASNMDRINEFPDKSKVKTILKEQFGEQKNSLVGIKLLNIISSKELLYGLNAIKHTRMLY